MYVILTHNNVVVNIEYNCNLNLYNGTFSIIKPMMQHKNMKHVAHKLYIISYFSSSPPYFSLVKNSCFGNTTCNKVRIVY